MSAAPKTLGTLALLTAALPFNAALTAVALLRGPRRRAATVPAPGVAGAKTILVTGGKMTKALQLARSFHAAGHRVVLVESAKYRLTGHRFSRAVSAFRIVPEATAPGYANALLDIVHAEGVDVFVPVSSPASSAPDAEAGRLLAPYCDVLHPAPDIVRRLDDKHAFSGLATDAGLPVPDAHRITDPDEVAAFDFAAHTETYVLKSIAYDPVRRLDLTPLPRATPAATRAFAAARPISAANPWVLQAFVPGEEFCTHSTVRDGEVRVYACCRSSASQLNYAMVDEPEIEDWVRRFARALGVTGQLSFDFMRADDGRLVAIECNPRTHSAITMFHDHPGLAAAYLEDGAETIEPLPASRPTYWLYHELWRLLRSPARAAGTVRTIARGKDAIFAWDDPLPFLLVHHLQIPALLLGNLVRGRDWHKIDFNIGKLVEPGGD